VARRPVALDDVPVVDGHVHPLFPDPWSVAADEVAALFSEGRPGSMGDHVAHTLYFRRACRDLARRLGGDDASGRARGRRAPRGGARAEREDVPDLDVALELRTKAGLEGARRLLAESRVAGLLVDTGYPPEGMTLVDMRRALPCAVHEVFRTETCAEGLIGRARSYDEFLDAFRGALRRAAGTCVGLKSIVAYRSGLAVQRPDPEQAQRAYRSAVARVQAGGSRRLVDKPLLDALFFETLEVARETGRPLQLHAGFGDPDIDLLQANPLLLRPILEDPRWREVRLVLLHMAYPYFREAAFMAAVWPQVFLDLSLAIPFLGPGVTGPLVEVLALAPSTKLLYGSDVRGLPELFALTADWSRAALGEALGWLVERDGLTQAEAYQAGRRILGGNTAALYRLAGP
jgi:predicted TIM-barrel fold metal-dependent hydrolase